MTNWKKVKLKEVLKQYRDTHWIEDKNYKQVTISQTGEVSYRGTKHGSQIGRKRQFLIDLDNHPQTLIFIRQGVFKNGIGICPPEVDGCIVTENMPMFDIVNINPEFLNYYIRSPQFRADVDMLVPLGTAQKAIHERQLLELEIPLPQKEIQEEIVRKVKSASKGVSELNHLNNKNETYISKLRNAILQEAVQGKLVKQNPADEPASVLLKKIKTEKDKLIKEGKIKKDKPLAPISKDEIPYELPREWEWVRLGDYFDLKTGATPSTAVPAYWGGKIKWLASGDVNKLEIFDCKGRITEDGLKNSNCKVLPKDSVMIALNGQGKTRGTVAMLRIEAACNQSLVAIISPDKNKLVPEYVYHYLKSNYMNIRNITGHTQRHGLNMKIVANLIIAVPPTFEQARIVEKVDKLMAYCDELEKQVKENQQNSEKLMGAVLKESFENGKSS